MLTRVRCADHRRMRGLLSDPVGGLLARTLCSWGLLALSGFRCILLPVPHDLLVEVVDELLDLGGRLLLGGLLLEVVDEVGAPGDLRVGEEGVEEVLELHHALLQELLTQVAEGLLLREVGEPVVGLHVELLLDQRLELPHR